MDISCSYWLLYLLLRQPMVGAHTTYFRFTAHRGLEFFNTLVIQYTVLQYYSVICRPSDHTVGMPRAEIRTQDGRSRGRDYNH